jgi:hypothetical protein
MITLEAIEEKQAEISTLISAFKKQSQQVEYVFPETQIALAPGEHYAGLILGKDGESSYHLILLPGEQEEINWTDALAWAKEQVGELPNRREQALLYANLKEEFKEAWYWSNTQHASLSDSAWCQYFSNGYQFNLSEYDELRARSVRRLSVIQ